MTTVTPLSISYFHSSFLIYLPFPISFNSTSNFNKSNIDYNFDWRSWYRLLF